MASHIKSIITAAVLVALLVSFVPLGGKVEGKPAGVRTAVELLGKKVRLDQSFSANGLKSVSRS